MNKRLISSLLIVFGLLVLVVGIYEHFQGNEGLAAGSAGMAVAAGGFAMRKKLTGTN